MSAFVGEQGPELLVHRCDETCAVKLPEVPELPEVEEVHYLNEIEVGRDRVSLALDVIQAVLLAIACILIVVAGG